MYIYNLTYSVSVKVYRHFYSSKIFDDVNIVYF